MPEKETNTTPKPTVYVNDILGVRMVDDNNGTLKISVEGSPTEYMFYTKAVQGYYRHRYHNKFLGRYRYVFFEKDDFLMELARTIIAW